MKRALLLLVLLLVLTGCDGDAMTILPLTPPAPPRSNAPYVYYYSYLHNAFVVERADGTDSFLLGEGLMEAGYYESSIDQIRWSSSGHYLSWLLEDRESNQVFIVRWDDQHIVLPETERLVDDRIVRWAPNQDWVIYEQLHVGPSGYEIAATLTVFDVVNEKVLLTHTTPGDVVYNNFMCSRSIMGVAAWTSDESGFVYATYNSNYAEGTYWQVKLDGTVSVLYDNASVDVKPDLPGVYIPECVSNNQASFFRRDETNLSPSGRYLIRAGVCDMEIDNHSRVKRYSYGQCIEDLITKHNVHVPHASALRQHANFITSVKWHPNEKWVLLGDNNRPAEGSCCRFWKSVSPDGAIQRDVTEGYSIEWLPLTIDTSRFPRYPAPVTALPTLRLQGKDLSMMSVAWHPDGLLIASLSDDEMEENVVVSIWQVGTGEVVERYRLPVESQQNGDGLYWNSLSWVGDQLILVTQNQNEVWDVRQQQPLPNLTNGCCRQMITDAAPQLTLLAPNGETAMAAECGVAECLMMVKNVDNQSQTQRWSWPPFGERSRRFFTYTPDSRTIITVEQKYLAYGNTFTTTTQIYERDLFGEERHYTFENIGFLNYGDFLKISPDGRYLAIVGYDRIQIVDRQQQRVIARYYGSGDDLAWSPDSTRFVTANASELRVWALPAEAITPGP